MLGGIGVVGLLLLLTERTKGGETESGTGKTASDWRWFPDFNVDINLPDVIPDWVSKIWDGETNGEEASVEKDSGAETEAQTGRKSVTDSTARDATGSQGATATTSRTPKPVTEIEPATGLESTEINIIDELERAGENADIVAVVPNQDPWNTDPADDSVIQGRPDYPAFNEADGHEFIAEIEPGTGYWEGSEVESGTGRRSIGSRSIPDPEPGTGKQPPRAVVIPEFTTAQADAMASGYSGRVRGRVPGSAKFAMVSPDLREDFATAVAPITNLIPPTPLPGIDTEKFVPPSEEGDWDWFNINPVENLGELVGGAGFLTVGGASAILGGPRSRLLGLIPTIGRTRGLGLLGSEVIPRAFGLPGVGSAAGRWAGGQLQDAAADALVGEFGTAQADSMYSNDGSWFDGSTYA